VSEPKTPTNTSPGTPNPNDWWSVLRSYLGPEQASLFTNSYNYLFKNRIKPQILSAIINSLGILALVLDGVSEKIAVATKTLELAATECAKQNQHLQENTEALKANHVELYHIRESLELMHQRIEKATVPWLKVCGIVGLNTILVALVLGNEDHLHWLRVPNSQDIVIFSDQQKIEVLDTKLSTLQDRYNRLQNSFNNGNEEAQNAIRREYDRGYHQALDDVQNSRANQ
jgi:chaperonin cofactor prefoldin